VGRSEQVNVYLDGMFFRLSGIGRCYENLLQALLASDEVGRVSSVVPESREREFRALYADKKLDVRFVDFPNLSPSDILLKGRLIAGFVPKPDLFHFPNINVPFFLHGTIISSINDVIPLSDYSDFSRIEKAGFRFLARHALRVSSRVVCISESCRDQVVEMLGVKKTRISVIYPWLNEEFPERVEAARRGPRVVEGDYILFVGNRYRHKNLKVLMEALRLLATDFSLLKAAVVGTRMRPLDDVDAADSDPLLRGRVLQFPQASDEVVANLYAFARVFVFPTLMEGFGIPPLEAMASGIPVVCSDIPVIREVCGDAVRYANPSDPASIACQVRCALIETERNGVFREKGIERVRRYTRGESIRRYMDLFRACMETGGGKSARGISR
jgi:glycosyltransferase involved in cell wall biosynthesis